jgi:hypothetical protein
LRSRVGGHACEPVAGTRRRRLGEEIAQVIEGVSRGIDGDERLSACEILRSTEAAIKPSLRAKRSNPAFFARSKLDCFVALLLAMTLRYTSAFSRRESPEL